MREMTQLLLRGLCLAAVLTAGSCSTGDGANAVFDDPVVNHPITVEPAYQSMKLSFSPTGIDPADTAHFEAFVSDYRQHGNGKIAISVPGGTAMQQQVVTLATRINEMGISRVRILVASRDATGGDNRVELNYVSYQAHAAACGDWSEDMANTLQNKTAANVGCSNQHNLAAMVSDPRDLLGPRAADSADARRRQTVIGNYEDGKPTGATKSADQSGAISDIGK